MLSNETTNRAAREQILNRARTGEINVTQAEAEAVNASCGPLASQPEAEHFDPLKKPWWSYSMVIAWIVSSDVEVVRQYDNDYRAKCLEWRPITLPSGTIGWTLVTPEKLAYAITMLDFGDEGHSAENALVNALTVAKISCLAIRGADYALVSVPAHDWTTLRLSNDLAWNDVIYFEHAPAQQAYRNPSFPQADVLKLWPGKARPSSARDEVHCKKWLIAEVAAAPTVQPKTKEVYFSEARRKWPAISERAFERAWGESTSQNENWGKGGRPKGSKKKAEPLITHTGNLRAR